MMSQINQRILPLALGFLAFGFFSLMLAGYYHDDAYIILRYAQNFLDGHGFVWNPGERVEGCSTFLWLLLITGAGYCGLDLVTASQVLGILLALATLFAAFVLRGNRYPLGILLLGTNSCFALWAQGGLETIAFGFFIFFACTIFHKHRQTKSSLIGTGLIFALATMTRPEGALFFGLTLLFCLLDNKQLSIRNSKRAALLLGAFCLLYAPYFLWRLLYYGHLFPCTFYVKGGTNLFKLLFGTRYVFHFLLGYGFPLIIILFIKDKSAFLRSRLYLVALPAIFCCYVISVGGDHMQGFRFLTPLLPVYYLLIQEAFHAAFQNKKSSYRLAVPALLITVNFLISYSSIPKGPAANQEALRHSYKYRNCFATPDPAAYIGKHVGTHIKQNWPRDCTIAVNTAGSIPYYSGFKAIDMLGLNDYTIAKTVVTYNYEFLPQSFQEIMSLSSAGQRKAFIKKIMRTYLPWELIPGHGKGDGDYVLARKPDYIILGPAQGDDKAWFPGDRELIQSNEFQQKYQLKKTAISVKDAFHPFYSETKTGTLLFSYYKRVAP